MHQCLNEAYFIVPNSCSMENKLCGHNGPLLGLLGVTRKSPEGSAVGRATVLCPALTETFMSLHGDLHSIGWRQMSLLWWGGVKIRQVALHLVQTA